MQALALLPGQMASSLAVQVMADPDEPHDVIVHEDPEPPAQVGNVVFGADPIQAKSPEVVLSAASSPVPMDVDTIPLRAPSAAD